MNALAPCPFCKKQDAYIHRPSNWHIQIVCAECGARGPIVHKDSAANVDLEAITRWASASNPEGRQ